MRDFLDQVDVAIATWRLYYLALFACLAIPDICGAMDADDGEATKARYLAWYDRYLAPKYQFAFVSLTGLDCYLFRCALLHEGTTGHPKSSYRRILFVEPGATSNVFHMNLMDDALNIDVTIFCRDVLASARQWLGAVENSDTYKRNAERFIRRYPAGLAPYIVGVPVIA